MKGLSFLFAISLAILTGCARVGGEERLVLDAERGLHVSGTAIVRTAPEVVTVEVGHAATTSSASEARASVDTVMERSLLPWRRKESPQRMCKPFNTLLHRNTTKKGDLSAGAW